MRFITETRLKLLEDMVRLLPDKEDRSYALHLIGSLRDDIEAHYAEIHMAYTLPDSKEEGIMAKPILSLPRPGRNNPPGRCILRRDDFEG